MGGTLTTSNPESVSRSLVKSSPKEMCWNMEGRRIVSLEGGFMWYLEHLGDTGYYATSVNIWGIPVIMLHQ